MQNVCHTCNSEDVPLAEDHNDEDDEQLIEWVTCDSCAEWHHILSVWRLRAFQSGLAPPENNLYPIDGHVVLSCIAPHVRLFVSFRLRQ